MAYTPFALLASVLILSLSFSIPQEVHSVSNQGFSNSISESWARTQNVYSLQSLKLLADRSLNREIDETEKKIEILTRNGSLSGEKIQYHAFNSWAQRSRELTSSSYGIGLKNLDVSVDNLTISASSQILYEDDLITEVLNSRSKIDVNKVKDPLASKVGLNYDIERCNFENISQKLYSGDNSNGIARGNPVKSGQTDISEVAEPSNKVILTQNVRRFNKNTTSEYAGYITLDEPPSPSSYNDNFVTDAPYIPSFKASQRVIIYNGVRKSNFKRMIDTSCYLPTAIPTAPSISDRIEGSQAGASPNGIFTLVDTDKIGTTSEESNILFQRINGAQNLVELRGITSADGIEWPYFKVGTRFADIRGFSDLSTE